MNSTPTSESYVNENPGVALYDASTVTLASTTSLGSISSLIPATGSGITAVPKDFSNNGSSLGVSPKVAETLKGNSDFNSKFT